MFFNENPGYASGKACPHWRKSVAPPLDRRPSEQYHKAPLDEAPWTGCPLDLRPSEQKVPSNRRLLDRRPYEQEAFWTGGPLNRRP